MSEERENSGGGAENQNDSENWDALREAQGQDLDAERESAEAMDQEVPQTPTADSQGVEET